MWNLNHRWPPMDNCPGFSSFTTWVLSRSGITKRRDRFWRFWRLHAPLSVVCSLSQESLMRHCSALNGSYAGRARWANSSNCFINVLSFLGREYRGQEDTILFASSFVWAVKVLHQDYVSEGFTEWGVVWTCFPERVWWPVEEKYIS